jgi:thiopeptide-type bacteriocin biosynthesis protein
LPSERCLYTLLLAPRENHDRILLEFVAPVVREIDGDAELDSLFFARYNKPDWQLRFRVLGSPAWVDGPVRALVERGLRPLRERGLIEGSELAEYEREYDRYGGEEGMRLAERIFHADTVACLDLLEADARGALAKSRREYSLLMTERFLDLMGFDAPARLRFYEFAYSWTVNLGSWQEEEMQILEARYQSLREGIRDLLAGPQSRDPDTQWGGPEPARIAGACLDRQRPVVQELLAAHAAGRIRQDLVNLAWSYTHMHCNRLGIEAWPEAILRFFLHRLYQDGPPGAVAS